MKHTIVIIWFALFWCLTPLIAPLAAQDDEEDLRVSGILDSTANFYAGAGDAAPFSYGIEEYANLRTQARLHDGMVFYGAFNLIAMSGSGLATAAALGNANTALSASPYIVGDNYAGAMELERLYFQVNGDVDVSAGLMPLHFGYGQVFAPSDFLNPRNPLFPDARARGILGASLALYPADETKLLVFGAAPKDATNSDGGGFRAGLSAEQHWSWLSAQLLYVFETPRDEYSKGRHRAGLSFKTDLKLGAFEPGLVAEALYTANPNNLSGIDGFSVSAGFDYSLLDGNLYILAEYLYSGSASVTARTAENFMGFANQHYLYANVQYRFSDYTSVSLGSMAGLEDVSFTPLVSLQHELFQGLNLTITAQVPLDRDLFTGNGERGEFGPIAPGMEQGYYSLITVKVRLRF